MGKYYQNSLPIYNEGIEGDVVGGIYRGTNYIAVKAPEGWIISVALVMRGNEINLKFEKGGAYIFRNAWDEKVVTINDDGLEVHKGI